MCRFKGHLTTLVLARTAGDVADLWIFRIERVLIRGRKIDRSQMGLKLDIRAI